MQVTWSDREIELGLVGRVGESNTRTITVDCAKIMDAYPAARIVCVLSRPDGATYTAPLAEDGKKRTVTLDAVDLAMPGTLRLELRAVEAHQLEQDEALMELAEMCASLTDAASEEV